MPAIQPSAISGFKEFLPEEQIVFNRMLEIIRRHYELFGFTPIEVSAVERSKVLLAKGGENTKLIYGLHLLERSDQNVGGDKDIALHFDLTVPLARYVAQNYGYLDFPFRRYQIQKVWRGERTQEKKGRFREFYQCDIDVIGDGELNLLHDAEMPAVINGIFSELQIGAFLIHLNNRKISQGILEHLGIPLTYTGGYIKDDANALIEDDKMRNTFSLLDSLEKCGKDLVGEAFMRFVKTSDRQFNDLYEVISHREANALQMLDWMQALSKQEVFAQGTGELHQVVQHMLAFGVPLSNFTVDLSVTRGLDYYTGTVYETSLVNHESIGSVCSGGRFDDLASLFIDRKLPGVGISIGLTRLFVKLQEAEVIQVGPKCPSKAIIFQMSPQLREEYFVIATRLRQAGIPTEVYLEERKFEKQTKYAVKKRIPLGIYLDGKRKEEGVCTVRDFRTGNEEKVPVEKLVDYLHRK